jgi:hypothetical protein
MKKKSLLVILLTIFLLEAGDVLGEYLITPSSQIHGRVQIPFEEFQQVYESQEKDKWCWAACISMLFHFYGHPIPQAKIVSSIYGIPVNMPAQAGIVIASRLNRKWQDETGDSFNSRLVAAYDYAAGVYKLDNPILVRELRNQHPIIIGVGPHAVVLIGVEYDQYPNGFINVTRATVFDPWPGVGIRYLNPQEIIASPQGYSFAATIRIEELSNNGARELLEKNNATHVANGQENILSKNTKTLEENPFRYIIEQCRNGIEQFKETKRRNPPGLGTSWDASISFPGASDTSIDRDEGKDSLVATYKRDSRKDAKQAFEELVEWAKKDLGEKWKADIKKSNSGIRTYWRALFSIISEETNVRISWFESDSDVQRVNIWFEKK